MPPPTTDELLERMGRHVPRFTDTAEVPQPRLGPGAWATVTPLPAADHNLALLAGPSAAADLAALRAALDGRSCLVFLSPEDDRALAPLLRREGLQAAGTSPLMRRALDATGPADPWVTRVASAAELGEALEVLRATFALDEPGLRASMPADPGVDVWVLREAGEVRSALVATADADLVGIYAMGTPAAHARRGYGRRLLEHVLADAARAGVGWAYLGATPAGLPLYRSLGFEPVVELPVWLIGGSTQFAAAV